MRSRTVAKLLVLCVIAGGVVALYFSPLRAYMTRQHINAFIEQLRALWYGPIILILSYAIGCIFAIPASIFILIAAVVWGWKFGTLYAMTGAMLGASVSYYAGRFLGEGLLARFGKAGEMVSRQVADAGFLSMLICRLIPGPPFALWNYAAGIAGMAFWEYFFATLLGTLPPHLIFAYCADSLFNGTMSQGDAIRRVAIVCLLLLSLTVVTTLLKRRFAPQQSE